MRRENRTILIVSILSLAGVGALWLSAHRYTTILQARRQPPDAAAARPGVPSAAAVDDFVAVRRAVFAVTRGFGDPAGQADPRAARLVAIRDRALADSGLSTADYVGIRRAYRAWRDGRAYDAPALVRALEAQRDDLASLDLGPWEPYDR